MGDNDFIVTVEINHQNKVYTNKQWVTIEMKINDTRIGSRYIIKRTRNFKEFTPTSGTLWHPRLNTNPFKTLQPCILHKDLSVLQEERDVMRVVGGHVVVVTVCLALLRL